MKVLLVNPPSGIDVYRQSRIRVAVTKNPFIALAMLGAVLQKQGHEVRIFDMMTQVAPWADLKSELRSFSPEMVGVTFTTPLAVEAGAIAQLVKEMLPNALIVAGGAHATALPEQTLSESAFDVAAIGEGEMTIRELASGANLKDILGIAYKQDENIYRSSPRPLIPDLDALPLPAWDLYDLSQYRHPNPLARKAPVGFLETSRGCKYNCSFCSSAVFGKKVRFKSPDRVLQEILHLKDRGFRDVLVRDSNFTSDLDRAKQICRHLIDAGNPLPWNLYTGVRVNEVDREFFDLALQSGCYSVSFGIESADEKLLRGVHKGQKVSQAQKAVQAAHDAGLDTVGFFMFGLPGETESTMAATTDLARNLALDYAKVTMTVPFPGTALFHQFDQEGRIKTQDWTKYNFHLAGEIFDHPDLSWDVIRRYYNRFYRRFYLRPSYLAGRLIQSIRRGRLPADLIYALRTRWL